MMSENLLVEILSDDESTPYTEIQPAVLTKRQDKTVDHASEEQEYIEQLREEQTSTPKPKQEYSRCVIASWKIRQFSLLSKAIKGNVLLHQYKSDSTLNSILADISNLLNGDKVSSIAFICHGNPGALTVCQDKTLSIQNIEDDKEIKDFFRKLCEVAMDCSSQSSHLDFLASSLLITSSGQQVVQELQEAIRVPVFASKEILGTDFNKQDPKQGNIGELYFNANLLRTWSASSSQSISNYEKIRTLGRGAYGTAVLYRKKDDDSLVVLKEISILDLSAAERQASMNEVRVLGMLSHPNIISYYDSFDEDGTLWIEMEYADGGTLSDYLSKQDADLEEREILIMFSQMVSAIRYCHDNNILHRDLKTENIFLTKEQKVKLGDFGIAKVMSTRNAGNFTVVGTPYYISPEMCEGKPYDSKSDIWALGCILYEMANLTKTFDGTNLPALITKIVKGTFAPIKEIYSPEFRLLVKDLLQKDTTLRPTSDEILYNRLPELLAPYEDFDETSESIAPVNYGRTRSLLYYCDVSTMQLHPIQELPEKIQVAEVSVGLGHIVIVSNERGVFSWGDNSYGQLGHGDYESREHPTEIVSLRGKSIVRASCGDYFTTFMSDNGLVLSCGQGEYGCLGHGDWNSITRPKIIDALMTLDIFCLQTGSYHLAVTTAEGEAYTWGKGEGGRLGHGNDEHMCVPTKVKFDTKTVFIRGVQCSSDGTFFIADTGTAFACGRNEGNKMGINPRQGFLLQFRSRSSRTLECAKEPTLNKDLCKYQVSVLKVGGQHTLIMNESGQVFGNGSNTEGQLGCGNLKPRDSITPVKGLEDANISSIACGSTFSFAGVQDKPNNGKTAVVNAVYFWGTRPAFRKHRTFSVNESIATSRTARTRRTSTITDDYSSDVDGLSNSRDAGSESSRKGSAGRGSSGIETNRRISRVDSGRLSSDGSFIENSPDLDDVRRSFLRNIMRGSNLQTLNMVSRDTAPVTTPQIVFKFASIGGVEGYDEEEEFPVLLQDIKCFHDHVVIHLETTAPPPKKKKIAVQKSLDNSMSSYNNKEENSEASEIETSGEIPTWIRNELKSGIPVFQPEDDDDDDEESSSPVPEKKPVYIDRGNGSDEERPITPRKVPLSITRTHSFDVLSRRGSINKPSRDPNFNIIPKLKKQSLPKVDEDDVKTETQIIDGVAVTKSITEAVNNKQERQKEGKKSELKIPNELPSAPISISPEIHQKRKKNTDEKKPGRYSEDVEFTPVTRISLQDTMNLKENIKSTESTKPAPKVSVSSKARQKRRDKEDFNKQSKIEKKLRSQDMKDTRKNVDANNNVQPEKLIEEFQRQTKISEEKLREEIKKIREDKEKREEELKRIHEDELKRKEEWSLRKEQEAKEREQELKDEIFSLKTDLNNQNLKLQGNHNILLSLQEQLLLMQQAQIRSNTEATKNEEEPQQRRPPQVDHSFQQKSSVCNVM